MASLLAKLPKFKPHHPYVIAVIGFVVSLLVFAFLAPVCVDTYKALRGNLFTGFFTVAGFLLSAKTLVILNMKKEIYEKENYLRQIHEGAWAHTSHAKKTSKASRAECAPTTHVYRPLSQVGTLLSVNIIFALATSFAQITLGLTDSKAAVVICLSLVLSTAFLLACSVFLMWLNFHSLYAEWERQAQEQLDKKWEASLAEFHAGVVTPQPTALPEVPTTPAGEKLPEHKE